MMKCKGIILFIGLYLLLALFPSAASAVETNGYTLILTENWRLTDDLDLNVPENATLTIDGHNTYYIYEFGGALINNGAGNVVLKDTILYPAGETEVRSLFITTAALPAARAGSTYSQTIEKSYTGDSTVTFSATGLPEGLSIDPGTGLISGTPASGANANSPYSVEVTATVGAGTLTATLTGALAATKRYSLAVNAAYSDDGDDDDHSGRSGGGASSTPAPTYKADVSGSGKAISLPVTVDTDSNSATVDVDIEQGNLFNSQKIVRITVPSIPNVNNYTLDLPADYLSKPDGEGILTFNTDVASVSIPENMLAGVEGNEAGITIGKGDISGLPDSVKAAIGTKPLIRLTLTMDGRQTEWNNPDAPVTVTIPYTPTAAELATPESIVIWYIDGSGNAVSVPNGHYDPVTGTVTFTTTHFSDYAVVYNKVSFNDVPAGAWYNKAVSFIAARGITGGKGGGNYDPDARLTRGDFLVLLMKSYDIASDANPTDNFSDAGNTYYTGYLAAAKRLGISDSVGNNRYAPAREITRQEMFTLLYNTLKVIHQSPQGGSGKTLSDFTDAGQIESWAKDAMTLLVETGTIGGNAGRLTPTSAMTRAEMAQVLCNLLSK
ncbi:S-layer homology domain-containing protein [Candidatus Formimonas warabiya]|uniref:SLH domain-containing protein n=1 Tax=Formimonas warabiya TaxID=1761012 RepID=A0A3G1KMS1_FORW1|nr:S-layer homology domain-containing protein [Candidatus Formimonas warabiya]ATW23754.1 hypothetical protein DCMF_02145 [Candidatus Formimonas warabiya]